MSAFAQIPVGVIIDRIKASNPWLDYVWQPSSVLPGAPTMTPWTEVASDSEHTSFYAGEATLELFRSSTGHYRDNLAGDNALWVILSPTGVEPPYEVLCVTADPTEGESFAGAGAYVIESVPMPTQIRDLIEAFVAEHHVEQPFFKRKRKRADPEALAQHGPLHEPKSETRR